MTASTDCGAPGWSASACRVDGTSCKHGDEVRPILGRRVQVAVETFGAHGRGFRRCGRETLGERLLELARAEDARTSAGDSDANAARRLRDEHADEREARRRA